DGAGGHDDHLGAARAEGGEVGGDPVQPVRAGAGVVLLHHEGAADLHHQALGVREAGDHGAAAADARPATGSARVGAGGLRRTSWIMSCNARSTSGTPCPDTPDSSITGRPDALRSAARRAEVSRGVIASALLRPISSGFSARPPP